MPRKLRIALLSAIPVAVVLLPVFVYAIDRAASNGEVARNVSAAGIDLGGLGRADAVAALEAYEASLAAKPVVFVVNDEEFEITPAEFGLDIDVEALADAALAQRQRGFFSGFFDWLDGFSDAIVIPIQVGYDPDRFDELLTVWEHEAIDDPAYNGAVVVVDGRALPDYPRSGQGIERQTAQRRAAVAIQTLERTPVRIPTRVIEPELDPEVINDAVEKANRLIGSQVTLRSEDPAFEIVFTPEQLISAFFAEVSANSPTQVVVGFDPAAVARLVVPFRAELEQPPRDAEFVVDEAAETVTLVPGRSETLVDVDLIVAALTDVALGESDEGELPLAEGEPAVFTTADAEAMMPVELVSKSTTRHAAGQPRVRNIHTIADAVDGAIVWPDEEFSLNEHVGPRTRDKGYVGAPMISGGELVDSVGGGVSQFATTFYNAVFFGCYEDVEHKPHSFYISRYPEVNEATVSWPEPNLVFRNDSDALIIIKTSYTSSSITVSFYGNNGGKHCDRRLGNRSAFTSPKDVFEPNAELDPGEQHVVQGGISGFTNSVVRVITHPDGTVEEQEWTWRYVPLNRIVEVHPCMIEGAEEECPILVPSVIGQPQGAAAGALEAAGFAVSVGTPVPVTDEAQNGLVVAQSVAGGEYLARGSTITIQVGVFSG